jgi:hypothetical protein
MSDDSDFLRRERLEDALREFRRRLEQRVLAADPSECWDLLLNRPPSHGLEPPHSVADPLPLRYETRNEIPVLRVFAPESPNRACPGCELLGRSHCCGGLVFLYYALRDAGVPRPLDRLALEIESGVWVADWERLDENRRLILLALRAYLDGGSG